MRDFDAEGESNKFQEKINSNDLNKVQKSSSFVATFNKLNEDFSKRINDLDDLGSKVTEDKDQNDEKIAIDNNKRKLVNQGSREDDV
jgi:hypothetical protein